jgi:hypothetical protein
MVGMLPVQGMRTSWVGAAGVTGLLGIAACALVTRFDPAVTSDDASTPAEGGNGGCTSTAVFCEDFESGTINNKTWNAPMDVGGTWNVDSRPDPVHSGNHALHLHSDDATQADAATQTLVAWETTGNQWPSTLYLRAFVWWGATLASANTVSNFLQLQNADRSAGYVLYAGTNQIGWTDWLTGDSRGVAMSPPQMTWTCVEWAFNGADVEVSINSQKNTGLGDMSAPMVAFSELDIGLLFSGPEPAMDLYIDDVVLDVNPIPCGS